MMWHEIAEDHRHAGEQEDRLHDGVVALQHGGVREQAEARPVNTVSTRMAPESTKPKFIITRVTEGSMALGATWLHKTRVSEAPLARAVSVKSSFMTLMIELRMMSSYSAM